MHDNNERLRLRDSSYVPAHANNKAGHVQCSRSAALSGEVRVRHVSSIPQAVPLSGEHDRHQAAAGAQTIKQIKMVCVSAQLL